MDDSSPVRTAAVLTCVAEPQPADAFRPAFCDRRQKIYLAREPEARVAAHGGRDQGVCHALERFIRFTRRPWVGTCFFGFEEPVENMPQYGLEYGRVAGISALLLCTDLKPEQKEPLLVNYVQVGIDLGGMIRAGHPGLDRFGRARQRPQAAHRLRRPAAGRRRIGQHQQVVPQGELRRGRADRLRRLLDGREGGFCRPLGDRRGHRRGRLARQRLGPVRAHRRLRSGRTGQNTSESYRRCCTSVGWVAQALALRLLHAEKVWNHDAFFDYVDRWMYENDADFVKTIKQATGRDYSPEWARQGQTWEPFVNEMWSKYRPTLAAPIDGWKQQHDDSYYRTAIKKMP